MRSIYSLNKNWLFLKDCSLPFSHIPQRGERIDLPHTWNALDGQDGGNDYFRGSCCYVRSIRKSELPNGEEYYLEINGANSSCDVYMNGKHLAHHDGGYSAFRVNISAGLREENCLSVIVDNSPNDRVYPQTADFTFYGGLYRDVNVIAVAATHFTMTELGTPGIHVNAQPDGEEYKVNIKTKVENLGDGDRLTFEICDSEGRTQRREATECIECELILQSPHLWNGISDPYLYTAKASISRDGRVLDTVSTRFGCRSFKLDPENGFVLNGKEYPLRGVSRHQDRKGIGNALLPEHHREDMELIREMGANTVRLAHYQHDKYFYDLCDEHGMVVWAEIPYISRHMSQGNENTVSQLKELITQCCNHPSIAVWGLSNEITMDGARDPDMIAQHRYLNDLAHELDPTRPTVIACISMCGIDEEYVHITDAVSYNHYFGWYGGSHDEYGPWLDNFHAKHPKTPIGISEYGCEALNWHNSSPEAGDYSEEYQAIYHESLIKQLFSRKYLWATHVWNMFDFGADARAEGGENGQNHKGLITFDRGYKKDAFYAYKAWLSKDPFVHICGKRYVDRVESMTKVTVYSNLSEVELFADGKSLGKKAAEDHFFYFDVPNEGETELRAVAGEYSDTSVIRRVETPCEDYILREQGAVLNWFDISEIPGCFSLNDKIGEIMKTDGGRLIMGELFEALAKKQAESGKSPHGGEGAFGKDMIKMLDSFTVLRLTGMLGMIDISFTKEELLAINEKLNQTKKPQE